MIHRMAFDPHPSSVAAARVWSVDALAEIGGDEHADVVELLVSELVTNAIRHTHGDGDRPPLEVVLRGDDGRVRVEVHDHDPTLPTRVENLDPLSTSGRGLALVETLADDSGVDRDDRGGKAVWFVLEAATGPVNND